MRERLSGGYLAETWRDGPLVTKTYLMDGVAGAEAAGLAWLSVPGGPPVPRVHGCDARTVTMDHVEPGPATLLGARAFGAALGRLNRTPAPAWGFSPSGRTFVGTVPVDVGEHPDWLTFWHARTAALLEHLPDVDPRPFEHVALAWDGEPVRAHGDLWSGNVLWAADGQAWLIDPAAHGGHPELDVALLSLFGAPHLEAILTAWEVTAVPVPGWRDRLPLHQVHTLLFHAIAFGGGYAQQAAEIASRF